MGILLGRATRCPPGRGGRRGVGMMLVLTLAVLAILSFIAMVQWLGGVISGGRRVMNEVVMLDVVADAALTEAANMIAARVNLFAKAAGGDPSWAKEIQQALVNGHDPDASKTSIPLVETPTLLDDIDPGPKPVTDRSPYISPHAGLQVQVEVKHTGTFSGPPGTQCSYGTIDLSVTLYRSSLKFGDSFKKTTRRMYEYKQVVVQPPGVLGAYTFVASDWGYGRHRYDTYTQHFQAFSQTMQELACRVGTSAQAKAQYMTQGTNFADRVYQAATGKYSIAWNPAPPTAPVASPAIGGEPHCQDANDAKPLCQQLSDQSTQFGNNPNLCWEFLHHMVVAKVYLPAYDVIQGKSGSGQAPTFLNTSNQIYSMDSSGKVQLIDPNMKAAVNYLPGGSASSGAASGGGAGGGSGGAGGSSTGAGGTAMPLALDRPQVDSLDDLQLYHRPPPLAPGTGTTATQPPPSTTAAPQNCSGAGQQAQAPADVGKAIDAYVESLKQRSQDGTLKSDEAVEDKTAFTMGDVPRIYTPTRPSGCPPSKTCDWFFSNDPGDGFSSAHASTTGQYYDTSIAADFDHWKTWHDATKDHSDKYHDAIFKNMQVKAITDGIPKGSAKAAAIKASFDPIADLDKLATYSGPAVADLLKPSSAGEVELSGLYLVSGGTTSPPATGSGTSATSGATAPGSTAGGPGSGASSSQTAVKFNYSGQGIVVAPALDVGPIKRGTKTTGNLVLLANGAGEITLEGGSTDAAIVSYNGYVASASKSVINGVLAVKDTPAGNAQAPAKGDADDQARAASYDSALPRFTVKRDTTIKDFYDPANAATYSHLTIAPFRMSSGGTIAQ